MIPKYILGRGILPGGQRLEKIPHFLSDLAGLCEECNQPVYYVPHVFGSKQLDGVWRSGAYFHHKCAPPGANVKAKPKPTKVPIGNLNSEEYRWWIGSRLASLGSDLAICRCCRTSIYNRLGRAFHFKDEKFRIGGENCTTRLTKAYKRLLNEMKECIICKKNRFGFSRWGVPLCESPECEIEWKFEGHRYLPLERILKEQKDAATKPAVGAQSEIRPAGFHPTALTQMWTGDPTEDGCQMASIERGGSIIPSPDWCHVCRMKISSPGHQDIHMRFMTSGGAMLD